MSIRFHSKNDMIAQRTLPVPSSFSLNTPSLPQTSKNPITRGPQVALQARTIAALVPLQALSCPRISAHQQPRGLPLPPVYHATSSPPSSSKHIHPTLICNLAAQPAVARKQPQCAAPVLLDVRA
jgi:hypothetical protein